jgi:hypothetical protein
MAALSYSHLSVESSSRSLRSIANLNELLALSNNRSAPASSAIDSSTSTSGGGSKWLPPALAECTSKYAPLLDPGSAKPWESLQVEDAHEGGLQAPTSVRTSPPMYNLFPPPMYEAAARAALDRLGELNCTSSRNNTDSPLLLQVFDGVRGLPEDFPRGSLLRSGEAVAARHRFASACVEQHPSYFMPPAYESRVNMGMEMGEGEAWQSNRTLLAAHGGTLWRQLYDFATRYQLFTYADWRWTNGFSGPWVEDVFRSTFFKPVAHRISLASAQARGKMLAALQEPDLGSELQLFVCNATLFSPQGLGTMDAFVHAADTRRRACTTCALTRGALEALREEGLVGACAPGAQGGAALFAQLFLILPYDAELFHPLVPIPPFFENVMWAANLRDELEQARTAPDWRDEAFALYPHVPGLPSTLIQEFIAQLQGSLKRDVHYITVVQRPDGPWLKKHTDYAFVMAGVLAHTVVINSGGNGHIPIPLLHTTLPTLPQCASLTPSSLQDPPALPPAPSFSTAQRTSSAAGGTSLVLPRSYCAWAGFHNEAPPPPALSFYGNKWEGFRGAAVAITESTLGSAFPSTMLNVSDLGWVQQFAHTTLAFAPRGIGATSYRLYEALQLGVVPVFVYDLIPWLPYLHPDHSSGVGFGGTYAGPFSKQPQNLPPLPDAPFPWKDVLHAVEGNSLSLWLQDKLHTLSPAGATPEHALQQWSTMMNATARLKQTHFTFNGVMKQIWRLLANPWSAELFCYPARRPATTAY